MYFSFTTSTTTPFQVGVYLSSNTGQNLTLDSRSTRKSTIAEDPISESRKRALYSINQSNIPSTLTCVRWMETKTKL
ncbi:unnamed protein product [Coffea canephora]|uniref:Uncharacterized protein n=1 Tax=Coffea canephora TaxID=49390 RepID=A0A068UQ57_COFCA|nr:unnamed protein product [Coffea canephora]